MWDINNDRVKFKIMSIFIVMTIIKLNEFSYFQILLGNGLLNFGN